jgi:hypothetical protein
MIAPCQSALLRNVYNLKIKEMKGYLPIITSNLVIAKIGTAFLRFRVSQTDT